MYEEDYSMRGGSGLKQDITVTHPQIAPVHAH